MLKRKATADSDDHRVGIAEALLKGAERRGRDGKGHDGLVGYMDFLAEKYPREYLAALVQLIGREPPRKEVDDRPFKSSEEAEAELRRRGLPMPQGWEPLERCRINAPE
ncbi:MAG: hypothetical protein ACREDC_04870 [Bradyrhizobium sp.]